MTTFIVMKVVITMLFSTISVFIFNFAYLVFGVCTVMKKY